MPLPYIELMDYYSRELPATPWVESRGAPWTPLAKPLAESRVMVLTSAGVRLKTEPPFQPANDLTFRLIDSQVDTADLAPSHPAPIRQPGEADINVVFPLDRLRELQAAGLFGALTPHHLSMLGPIRKFRELHHEMSPAMAQVARDEGADLVFLVPL